VAERTLGAGAGAQGELGLLMEAERDYCRALQLIEKSAGKDSLIYAKVSTNLARHYLDRGETRLAETTIRPAIAVYEKSPPPPGDIRLAVALHCLADVELRLRQFDDAASILQQAIKIFEESPVQNRAHLAATSNSLAAVRSRQGRREDAIDL
jgi:tetratricopeptide (TPR) repeat protein